MREHAGKIPYCMWDRAIHFSVFSHNIMFLNSLKRAFLEKSIELHVKLLMLQENLFSLIQYRLLQNHTKLKGSLCLLFKWWFIWIQRFNSWRKRFWTYLEWSEDFRRCAEESQLWSVWWVWCLNSRGGAGGPVLKVGSTPLGHAHLLCRLEAFLNLRESMKGSRKLWLWFQKGN